MRSSRLSVFIVIYIIIIIIIIIIFFFALGSKGSRGLKTRKNVKIKCLEWLLVRVSSGDKAVVQQNCVVALQCD